VTGLRRALLVIAAAALALGLAGIPVVLSSNHNDDAVPQLMATLVIGWSFVGTGIYAWWRRPGNSIGTLMTLTGFFWLLFAFNASNSPGLFIIGMALPVIAFGFLVHLLLSFPDGRLSGRLERSVVITTYLLVTVVQWITVVFGDTQDPSLCGPECPANPLLIAGYETVFNVAVSATALIVVAVIAGLLVALRRRWKRWAPATRNAYTPVLWTGAAVLVLQSALLVADVLGASDGMITVVFSAVLFPLAAIPYAYLAGVLRTRLSQADAVGELITSLSRGGDHQRDLVEMMSGALGDPALDIAFWVPELEGYVDSQGIPVEVPANPRRWTAVQHDGRPIAVLLHGAPLEDGGDSARRLAAAAALNLENERLEAELRSRVRELRASRRRLVEAGDAERTRVERNLHDGAQQRLVALALSLRLARSKVEEDPARAAGLLDEATGELEEATRELRELARGIHPAILTDRGLEPALEALASRAAIPVYIDSNLESRLPAGTEAAAYYVVAEALTNVARHAGAGRADVTVGLNGGDLEVTVRDDGQGGADPEGSGLRGLADRVGAADGTLLVADRPGGGTEVQARIPVAP